MELKSPFEFKTVEWSVTLVSYVQYHVVESDVHGMKPESLEQEG
jgi:hypothetical protein